MHLTGTTSREPPKGGSAAQLALLPSCLLVSYAASPRCFCTRRRDRSRLRASGSRDIQSVEFGVAARPAARGISLITLKLASMNGTDTALLNMESSGSIIPSDETRRAPLERVPPPDCADVSTGRRPDVKAEFAPSNARVVHSVLKTRQYADEARAGRTSEQSFSSPASFVRINSRTRRA